MMSLPRGMKLLAPIGWWHSAQRKHSSCHAPPLYSYFLIAALKVFPQPSQRAANFSSKQSGQNIASSFVAKGRSASEVLHSMHTKQASCQWRSWKERSYDACEIRKHLLSLKITSISVKHLDLICYFYCFFRLFCIPSFVILMGFSIPWSNWNVCLRPHFSEKHEIYVEQEFQF